MKREQPVIEIMGTAFLVDVNKLELRQQDNPQNRIVFTDMYDTGYGYSLTYCPLTKSVPAPWDEGVGIRVKIPEWVQLDPVGMAQKYKLPLEAIKGKTDFEIMVDQEAFDSRVNKGRLPTIDIAGHTFYVDLRMDKLRPKDDFGSNGIVFGELDEYSNGSNAYLIPYDPRTHEFREPDYHKITEFPKDLIAIQFPFPDKLDPVGWNRLADKDIKTGLKIFGLKSHHDAKTVPWEETFLDYIIKRNLGQMNKEEKKQKIIPASQTPASRKNKGRKL